jgi:hypothetical protein
VHDLDQRLVSLRELLKLGVELFLLRCHEADLPVTVLVEAHPTEV